MAPAAVPPRRADVEAGPRVESIGAIEVRAPPATTPGVADPTCLFDVGVRLGKLLGVRQTVRHGDRRRRDRHASHQKYKTGESRFQSHWNSSSPSTTQQNLSIAQQ